MAILSLKDFSFTYALEEKPVLKHINWQVAEGDFVLLCGPTASGKSTLLKNLKKQLQPAGKIEGQILYAGQPLAILPDGKAAQEIGFVQQNPEAQILMEDVKQELAFGLENACQPLAQMHRRIGELSNFFGLQDKMQQKTQHLSGGQKQLVNLASVLLLQPKLLLLDEPTAQLDPIAAKDFLQILKQVHEELGITIIISEHRWDDILPLVQKVAFLTDGCLQSFASAQNFSRFLHDHGQFATYLPAIPNLYFSREKERNNALEVVPFTPVEGYLWGKKKNWQIVPLADETEQKAAPTEKSLLVAKEISFRYEKNGQDILRNCSMALKAGEIGVIMGGNGAGKSTLLKLLAGLLPLQNGAVMWWGRNIRSLNKEERITAIAYMGQNPMQHFVCDTVEKELSYGLTEQEKQYLPHWISRFGLQDILQRHPYDISGGQQQKVVLAYLLCRRPQLLLLDEPGKALDPVAKKELISILKEVAQKGTAILLTSHDCEFASLLAQKATMLFDGCLTEWQPMRYFLRDNYFYTTALAKIFTRISQEVPLCIEEAKLL